MTLWVHVPPSNPKNTKNVNYSHNTFTKTNVHNIHKSLA